MDSIKPLFTAVGSVTGGRNGHGEAEDHSVSVNLSVPKAMGGPGRPNTTTPEHLFAVGYAACFGGALDFVAVQKKKNAKGATVTCSVSIGPRDAGGFGIAVKLHVKDATLPQAEHGPCEDRGGGEKPEFRRIQMELLADRNSDHAEHRPHREADRERDRTGEQNGIRRARR